MNETSMPAENEKELWQDKMIREMGERVAKQIHLTPDHPVMTDIRELVKEVADLFVAESRKRTLEEVEKAVERMKAQYDPKTTYTGYIACLDVLSCLQSLKSSMEG